MSDYSITIIVGRGVPTLNGLWNGLPGHASVVINGPESTTYLGLGPQGHAIFRDKVGLYSTGDYDVVTVPRGTSPVVPAWGQVAEYGYVVFPLLRYPFVHRAHNPSAGCGSASGRRTVCGCHPEFHLVQYRLSNHLHRLCLVNTPSGCSWSSCRVFEHLIARDLGRSIRHNEFK